MATGMVQLRGLHVRCAVWVQVRLRTQVMVIFTLSVVLLGFVKVRRSTKQFDVVEAS